MGKKTPFYNLLFIVNNSKCLLIQTFADKEKRSAIGYSFYCERDL